MTTRKGEASVRVQADRVLSRAGTGMGMACKGEVLQSMDEWGRKGAWGIWLGMDSGKGTAGKAVGPWPAVG